MKRMLWSFLIISGLAIVVQAGGPPLPPSIVDFSPVASTPPVTQVPNTSTVPVDSSSQQQTIQKVVPKINVPDSSIIPAKSNTALVLSTTKTSESVPQEDLSTPEISMPVDELSAISTAPIISTVPVDGASQQQTIQKVVPKTNTLDSSIIPAKNDTVLVLTTTETSESVPQEELSTSEVSMPVDEPSASAPLNKSVDGASSQSGKNVVVKVSIQEEKEDKESQSIDKAVDTLNLKTGGNLLLKRVWWEKTEEVYEQIKEVFNHVMDSRMQFISKRNELDRELDIFYGEMGIEQGPLQDLINHAKDLMEKEKSEQGYLDKKEQAFVQKLSGKERDLEQLKLDIKAIQEVDAKVDEALDTLFKQIDVCNQYEQKAWDNFKEIARELDDKEARKLYYATEGLYKDVQKVQAYLSGTFSEYFTQLIQSANEHTGKISSEMNALKKEGLDLVKEAEILEKDEVPQHEDRDKQPQEIKKGWFDSIKNVLSAVLGRVGDLFSAVFNKFPEPVCSWLVKTEKKSEQEIKTLEKDINPIDDSVEEKVKSVAQEAGQTFDSLKHDVNDFIENPWISDHDEVAPPTGSSVSDSKSAMPSTVQQADRSISKTFEPTQKSNEPKSVVPSVVSTPVEPVVDPIIPSSGPSTEFHQASS